MFDHAAQLHLKAVKFLRNSGKYATETIANKKYVIYNYFAPYFALFKRPRFDSVNIS